MERCEQIVDFVLRTDTSRNPFDLVRPPARGSALFVVIRYHCVNDRGEFAEPEGREFIAFMNAD